MSYASIASAIPKERKPIWACLFSERFMDEFSLEQKVVSRLVYITLSCKNINSYVKCAKSRCDSYA